MAVQTLAALLAAKKVADILNGLTSGKLPETLARHTVVRAISDVMPNGFPFSTFGESLKQAEYAYRQSRDPIGALLAIFGSPGLDVLPETPILSDGTRAPTWQSLGDLILSEARAAPDIDPGIAEALALIIHAEEQAGGAYSHFLATLQALVRGYAVSGGAKAPRNAVTVGDPIVLGTGAFEKAGIDISIDGAGIALHLRRTYRSNAALLGPLGPNWDHSLNLRLREEPSELLVTRLTGGLAEQTFVQHPAYGSSPGFTYYVPPNGVHGVMMANEALSFTLRRPQGGIERYQRTDGQLGHHRITLRQDRFGNYLQFFYDDHDRLRLVHVNSEERYLSFTYDDAGRLRRVDDHADRIVLYEYDDWGLLCGVSAPTRSGDVPIWLERYDYELIGGGLKLARVYDWQGRIVVENEYEYSPLSSFFGYVTRQRVHRGESHYVYEFAPEAGISGDEYQHVPYMRVLEYRRNGHRIDRVLNEYGNELLKHERYVSGGDTREALTFFRYNADGEVIGQLRPDGVLVQTLYGREHLADTLQWPALEHSLGDITYLDRMSFGNRLAEVTRATRPTHPGLSSWTEFWEQVAPTIKSSQAEGDFIIKYCYDHESQLLKSRSDPRFTSSPDPNHPESSRPGQTSYDPGDPVYEQHHRHLTTYEYGGGPHFALHRVVYPNRTRPSDTVPPETVEDIEERFDYDDKWRPIRTVDVNGYEWVTKYFEAADATNGFVRAQLHPHADWTLDSTSPDTLEVATEGTWTASADGLLSSGASGDQLTVRVEGTRVTLYQMANVEDSPRGDNLAVEVRVDGQLQAPWNQVKDISYLVDDLGPGLHGLELRDSLGQRISVGRVRSHVTTEFQLDALGRVEGETDARGNERTYCYNASGDKVHEAKGPSVAEFGYEPGGLLTLTRTEWHDDEGNFGLEGAVITRHAYDESGNVLLTSIGTEGDTPSRTIRYGYDAENNLRTSKNARDIVTHHYYDALNREVCVARAACSCDYSASAVAYDEVGHVLYTRNPRGAVHYNGHPRKDGSLQDSFDHLGRATIETDALGNVTLFRYDKLNNKVVTYRIQRLPSHEYELISRVAHEYDEHGDRTVTVEAVFTIRIPTDDPVDLEKVEEAFDVALSTGDVTLARTEYYLDPSGNCIATRDPEGRVKRRTFDGQKRVFQTMDTEGGRMFRVFDGNGNITRTYNFDPERNPESGEIVGYQTFLRLREYDRLDRAEQTVDPFGNRWRKMYDSLGNLTRTIDPLDSEVRYEYNAFGEKESETRYLERPAGPLPLVSRYSYDGNGNLIEVEDPAGRRTRYRYDALDRRSESWFAVVADAPKEYRHYDRAGNVVSIVERNGLRKTLTYDLLDRHEFTDVDTSGVDPANALSRHSPTFESFAYDAHDSLIRHENDYCVVEITRDSRGAAVEEEVHIRGIAGAPSRQTVTRAFSPAGYRDRLTYPSGRELIYRRDGMGRVTSIVEPPGRTLGSFTYVGSRLTRIDYANGLSLTLRYDGRGHVYERAVVDQEGTTLWRSQKFMDAALRAALESKTTRAAELSVIYSHDSVNRLFDYHSRTAEWFEDHPAISPPLAPVDPSDTDAQAVIDDHVESLGTAGDAAVFEYDEMGNRTRTREPGLPTIVTNPNHLNQYAEVDSEPWTYDPQGNLRTDDRYDLAYDHNDLVQEIVDREDTVHAIRYYRDALARVIAECEQGMPGVFWVYDRNVPAAVEIGGVAAQELTPGPVPASVFHAKISDDDFWITRDGLSSVRLVTNGGGDVVSMPAYRPFGEPEDDELTSSPVRGGFAGMWHTTGVPFLHLRRRTYRADVGRYLQRDPAEFVDGLNLYTYVGNDPASYLDTSGYVGLHETAPPEVAMLEAKAAAAESRWLGNGALALQLQLDAEFVEEMASSVQSWHVEQRHFVEDPVGAHIKYIVKPKNEELSRMAWMMMNVVGLPLSWVTGWEGVAMTAFGVSVDVASGGASGWEGAARVGLALGGKWSKGLFDTLELQRMGYIADVGYNTTRRFWAAPPGWWAMARAASSARTETKFAIRGERALRLADWFDSSTKALGLRSSFNFNTTWSSLMTRTGYNAQAAAFSILSSAQRINPWPMRLIEAGRSAEGAVQAVWTLSPLWREE